MSFGAIIGDLAAWTWEHDRKTFYSHLVASDARLSENGLVIVAAFENRNSILDFENFRQGFLSSAKKYTYEVDHSNEWMEYYHSNGKEMSSFVRSLIYICGVITAGWSREWDESYGHLCGLTDMDKDGMYTGDLARIIFNLRQGQTKKEAIGLYDQQMSFTIKTMINWYDDHSYGKQEWFSVLDHVGFAWKCFMKSWDYTSAIHNTMVHCPSCFNRHFCGILTGALAEAMYGCELNLIKLKYTDDKIPFRGISIPPSVARSFMNVFDQIRNYERSVRIFFPKNDSLTNVELHSWTDFDPNNVPQKVSDQQRSLIMKSFYPSWEHRFSFYLDNGFFYVCRSGRICARFKMLRQSKNIWKIILPQRCIEEDMAQTAIEEAFYTLRILPK